MGEGLHDTRGEVVKSTLIVGSGHCNGIISQIRIDFSIMVFISALLPDSPFVLLSFMKSLVVLSGLLLCAIMWEHGRSRRGPAYYKFLASEGCLSHPSPPSRSSSNSPAPPPMADPTFISLALVENWGPIWIEGEPHMVPPPDPRLLVSLPPSPDPLASTNIEMDVDPHREIQDEH